MSFDASLRELLELAEACCADRIDDDGLARIDELLHENPERCEIYSRYLAVHVCLRRVLSNAVDPHSPHIVPGGTSTGGVPHSVGDRLVSPSSPRHSVFLLAASIGLVATVFYGTFVLLAINLRDALIPDPIANDLAATSSEVVSTVTAAEGCTWRIASVEATPSIGTQLRANESFELVSGLLELTFADQTTVVLEGPAHFTVQDAGRGLLELGKLVARVPPQAVGFTIMTPSVKVVDLGTEFGVNTSISGETTVDVFRGRVQVHPLVDSTQIPRSPFLLTAGQAKRIAIGGEVTVAGANKMGTWRLLANRLARKQLIFPDSLIAYWDFNEHAGRVVSDQRNDHHGSMDAGARVGGLVGHGAVRFGNNGERVKVPFHNDVIALGSELTIEAALVSSWSGKPDDDDYIFRKQDNGVSTIRLVLTNASYGEAKGPVLSFTVSTDHGVHSIHMPFDGRDGRYTLEEFTNGRPHYIAATFNGTLGQMCLFVDGVECTRGSIDKNSMIVPAGGTSDQQSEPRKPSDSLSGVLDEVAIYRTAIPLQEITHHWNNLTKGRSFFEN